MATSLELEKRQKFTSKMTPQELGVGTAQNASAQMSTAIPVSGGQPISAMVAELVWKKLSHVANVCEYGGHTNRAKMFRAVRDELLWQLRSTLEPNIASETK